MSDKPEGMSDQPVDRKPRWITVIDKYGTMLSTLIGAASVIVLAISVMQNSRNTTSSSEVSIAGIQLDLRENYLRFKTGADQRGMGHYSPGDECVSSEDRQYFQSYWVNVVFSEYLATQQFGNARLRREWDVTYGKLIAQALRDYPILREEFCQLKSDGVFFGDFHEPFFAAVFDAYEKHKNGAEELVCQKQIQTRKRSLRRCGDVLVSGFTNATVDRTDPCNAVIQEAIEASEEGNYAIGACVVDSSGKIFRCGHNRVFSPEFRSDLHAEMDVLNLVEAARSRGISVPDRLTLISSLEPCPMCLTRSITAGVENVYYLAEDREGGMVSRIESLPPVWQRLSAGRTYEVAYQCSSRCGNWRANSSISRESLLTVGSNRSGCASSRGVTLLCSLAHDVQGPGDQANRRRVSVELRQALSVAV